MYIQYIICVLINVNTILTEKIILNKSEKRDRELRKSGLPVRGYLQVGPEPLSWYLTLNSFVPLGLCPSQLLTIGPTLGGHQDHRSQLQVPSSRLGPPCFPCRCCPWPSYVPQKLTTGDSHCDSPWHQKPCLRQLLSMGVSSNRRKEKSDPYTCPTSSAWHRS